MWIKLTNKFNKHPILINSNRVCSVVKHNAENVSVVSFSENDYFHVIETVEEIEAMLGIKGHEIANKPFFLEDIDRLQLSGHLIELLKSIGIETIADLCWHTEDQLHYSPAGISTMAISDIKKELEIYDLCLS